jgi:hypothetical protein
LIGPSKRVCCRPVDEQQSACESANLLMHEFGIHERRAPAATIARKVLA